MLKTLLAQVREFKKASFLTPFFMILEVLFETLIPLSMASIIDKGVEAGNIGHIYRMGAVMVALALCGLWSGVMGGKYGALASTGFARNLRKAMYTNIQTFSFSNIDKYSTAGLITRLTTDVTNLQNAYQMILRMCTRAPASLICAMVMAFLINAKLASIYLVAVIFLGGCLIFIMQKATVYFRAVFRKYDDLNASVQENIGAVRVVKAYVREDYEISKFQKACNKVYEMFLSAEKIVVMNMPLMQFTVYACILGISWLGAKMIVGSSLTTGELMSLLTYAETPSGMLNSIGLQNPGVAHLKECDLPWLAERGATVIVNVSGHSFDEYVQVIEALEDVPVDAYEVNISCPNVDAGGMTIGTCTDSVEAVVSRCRAATKRPLIVKLTPNVTDVTEIARAAVSAGADALSLINTLLGMAIDAERRRPQLARGVGGLSGPAVKPVALRMVWEVHQAVDVPLLGMGGISCATDAVEFMLAGATAVAVGTANFVNPHATVEIIDGMAQYCERHGIEDVQQLIGALEW